MFKLVGTLRGLFKKHPFLINSAIYGSLYVAAEYSQQFVCKRLLAETSEKRDIDYATIGRYAVMGTVIYAPSLYIWYKWLDRRFYGTSRNIIIKKLILDQFLLTPFLLVVFFTGMCLMEQAIDPFSELREKFIYTFMSSCAFWLPAQTVNFLLITPKFRIMYMGVCGFIWVNIVCWIKREKIYNKTEVIDN